MLHAGLLVSSKHEGAGTLRLSCVTPGFGFLRAQHAVESTAERTRFRRVHYCTVVTMDAPFGTCTGASQSVGPRFEVPASATARNPRVGGWCPATSTAIIVPSVPDCAMW